MVDFMRKKAPILNSNKFAGAEGVASIKCCKTVDKIILVQQWGVPGPERCGTPARRWQLLNFYGNLFIYK